MIKQKVIKRSIILGDYDLLIPKNPFDIIENFDDFVDRVSTESNKLGAFGISYPSVNIAVIMCNEEDVKNER